MSEDRVPSRRFGSRRWLFVWGPLAAAGLIAFSFAGSGYLTRFMTKTLMFVILAQSWNLLAGFTGYVSFGHVAFFGMGAYITGYLMLTFHLPFVVGLVAAGVMTTAFASLIGFPVLRLKGHYFAVATFSVAEALRELSSNLSDITGGGMGMRLPLFSGSPREVNQFFFLLMFALAVVTIMSLRLLLRSRLGYGWRAIRENEDAAGCLGVNTTSYKLQALLISAFFTALAGGIYAYWINYIEPGSAFDVKVSIAMVITVIMGGAGTLWGPVIGTVFLELVSEVLWGQFLQFHMMFLGALMILVVIFMPMGFMGLKRDEARGLAFGGLLAHVRRYRAD